MSIIPAIWEVEMGGLKFKVSLRKNVKVTLSQQNKLGIVVCAYNPSYAGPRDRRIEP
jgi:hypothetical protein